MVSRSAPRREFPIYKDTGYSVNKLLVLIAHPEFERFFEEAPPLIAASDIER
jgi:hypothetical protein